MRKTYQDIVNDFNALGIVFHGNVKQHGVNKTELNIVAMALNDLADEARKISEFDLCEKLIELSRKFKHAAQHGVQLTSGGRGKNKGRVVSATRN